MRFRALSICFLKAFFVLNLSLVTLSAFSQGKNFSIDRKDPLWIVKLNSQGLKPKAKDILDGYFLALYENQTHAELDEEYTHLIREIVSDAGVQNASQISITYDPGFQKLVLHKVIVWRDNQPLDQLITNKFKILQKEKDLSKFIYRGTYDAFLLLNDIRKGDRIEYAYTVKGSNPIYGKKLAATIYFEGSSSIGHLYNNLIFDKKRNLSLKNFNFIDKPKITEKDGLKMYEWESKLTKTSRVADFEPSWYNTEKRTQFTEYKNWNEVVNWGLSVNDYSNIKTPLLNKKTEELWKKAGADTTKYIESTIRFAQDEIRYMGIEMGIYSHRPNSPEKVIAQRYGDCKDKSLLLVHLLKAKGIEAYSAYVDTYSTIKTNEYLPSPFVFNHVVVMVDRKKVKTWIDPTISYQRGKFKELYFPNYGYALVLKKGNNALEQIRTTAAGKQIAHLKFNIADTLSDKASTLLIKTTYTGNYANNMRQELAESGAAEIEKSYAEYYADLYTDIEVDQPLKFSDNEQTNTIEVTESYKINDIWEEDTKTGEKYVAFYGDLIRHQLQKVAAKNRPAPLLLKFPTDLEQIITAEMPFESKRSNGEFKLENDQYSFELNRSQLGKTQTFHYKLRNLKAYIEGSNIKKYVKDREKISEYLTYYVDRKVIDPTLDVNPYTLVAFILTFIASGLYFMGLYKQSAPFDLERIEYAQPISGWLILLAIRMITLPIGLAYKLFSLGYFNGSIWDGIATLKYEYLIKGLFIIESVGFALLIAAAILCIILFFNKRERFPRLYINFSIGFITFTVIDFISGMLIAYSNKTPFADANESINVFISITISFAWILYLQRSEQVKETFVFTYPEIEWKSAIIKKNNDQLFTERVETIIEEESINDQAPVSNSDINNHEKF
ncbi:DUF3857 domain-containing protein [Pedobacter hiemivivus]|uniref:DUF3857 domain-containing protein n=1 Tax=Pedobacter hiemivivus TaxID=2530454 RepID=A0A4U1GID4_9SPHI|nr:DUF3857 domain-containing protein [Pedobacter hiemivivus]